MKRGRQLDRAPFPRGTDPCFGCRISLNEKRTATLMLQHLIWMFESSCRISLDEKRTATPLIKWEKAVRGNLLQNKPQWKEDGNYLGCSSIYIAQNQCDPDVVVAYEILSKLLEKRNAFAHAFTDKDLLSKISVRNINSVLDDLEPLLDALYNSRLALSFSSIWQSYKQQISNE